MIVNNRRKAANAVSTSKVVELSAFSDVPARQKLVPELFDVDKNMLKCFETIDGRTEADVYTVFRCRPVASQGRVAVETDIPPLLVAEEIIGLDKLITATEFGLPTWTVQRNPSWLQHLPKFSRWLYSRSRYPEVSAYDRNAIVPAKTSNMTIKEVSSVDTVELYFSVFHGTLMEYIFTKNIKYAKLAWQVLRSTRFVIEQLGPAKPITEEEKATLLEYIRHRDSSLEAAVAYKTFIASLHPAQYYSALYSLMRTYPEVVHRSQVVNMESIIWGYLCLNQLPFSTALPLPALDTDILRLTIERGLQKASLPANPKCVTKSELVQFCHERMGTRLQNMLRNTCEWWSLLRVLDANRFMSWEVFSEVLLKICQATQELKGIMAYCFVIDPKTTITEEALAEMWLAKCQTDSKYVTLQWKNEEKVAVATPYLDAVITKTVDDLREAREALEQERKSNVDVELLLERYASPSFNRPYMECYARTLYSLAQDPQNIPILDTLIKRCKFISARRQTSFVMRAAGSVISPVFAYFKRQNDRLDDFVNTSRFPRRSWMSNLLWKLRTYAPEPLPQVAVAENKVIEFVPFQISRELSEKVVHMLQSIKVRDECPVCMAEVRKMIVLHNDQRHLVCQNCVLKLDTCPFCREVLVK